MNQYLILYDVFTCNDVILAKELARFNRVWCESGGVIDGGNYFCTDICLMEFNLNYHSTNIRIILHKIK